MVNQKALNDKVTKLLVSPPNETDKNRTLHLKERKEYLEALNGMSAHHGQNVFFDIRFGHNPFAIMMEDLFWSQRTMPSSSTNFLHTNFCGGATHLTMPSSHHWPGILFSFLLMLLTPTGRELCSNCFQENDVNVDGYDWDEALAWILNMSTYHQY